MPYTPASLVQALWPSASSPEKLNPAEIFTRYDDAIRDVSAASGPSSEDLLDQVRKMAEDEDARLSSVDSRAGQLLAAAGITATLVTTAVNQKGLSPVASGRLWLIVAYCVSLVYFVRCILLALRVHGARRRFVVGPDDLSVVTSDFQRHIAVLQLKALLGNYQTDNVKAELLYTAQRCFRNAIIVVGFGGLFALWT